MADRYYPAQDESMTLTVTAGEATISPTTDDMTNYETTYQVTTSGDVRCEIQNSTDKENWDTVTTFNVDNETATKVVQSGGYHRLTAYTRDESDTTISLYITASSSSPTYCTVSKVVGLLNLKDSDGTRLTLDSSTVPTETELINRILEAEDYLDSQTNHAWRSRSVSNEYHDWPLPRYRSLDTYAGDERRIHFNHRKIRSLTSGTHKIEYWDGSSWTDLVADYTEGRGNDFWVDYNRGIVFFTGKRPSRTRNAVRLTYAYGEDTVPKDIEWATAALVAIDYLLMDDSFGFVPEGGERPTTDIKIQRLQDRVDKIISRHTELRAV